MLEPVMNEPLKATEEELRNEGFALNPDNPNEAVPPDEEETPTEEWSLDQLAAYIKVGEARADKRAGEAYTLQQMECAQRFRTGRAVHLAHLKNQKYGEWGKWLEEHNIKRTSAWYVEQLYLRATEKYGERAEKKCAE